MGKRRSSRELALKFLYQSELNEGNVDEQMESFMERNSSKDEIDVFMKELVEAVIKHKKEIDEIVQKFSDNWVLDRMTVIDRNILRIGTCELLFNFSTPPKVAINEAVDIAKKYGNEDSPEFINGILDKIYKEIGQKKGPLPFTG
ncbi:MAG: transcription antitermination factor NusB [Nitrospinaceae bacterium]|jgi:N utilization substance protein B|nr:transcription antitermination factor NusB [Nitrospinaceae bacterium]MDP7557157.1 transcription antitermination factor NusB [Nitrospinaceae bacterium]HJO56935.1 transcription antitermination factor NusB [Nitrospinaceae bacterium]|tara:strand:+ start:3595 stop:4029 length:435 start_codon:yes stop_codon:yes gene_type:complete